MGAANQRATKKPGSPRAGGFRLGRSPLPARLGAPVTTQGRGRYAEIEVASAAHAAAPVSRPGVLYDAEKQRAGGRP